MSILVTVIVVGAGFGYLLHRLLRRRMRPMTISEYRKWREKEHERAISDEQREMRIAARWNQHYEEQAARERWRQIQRESREASARWGAERGPYGPTGPSSGVWERSLRALRGD